MRLLDIFLLMIDFNFCIKQFGLTKIFRGQIIWNGMRLQPNEMINISSILRGDLKYGMSYCSSLLLGHTCRSPSSAMTIKKLNS